MAKQDKTQPFSRTIDCKRENVVSDEALTLVGILTVSVNIRSILRVMCPSKNQSSILFFMKHKKRDYSSTGITLLMAKRPKTLYLKSPAVARTSLA